MAWFVGLMSGTSLDGIDAVLADIAPDGSPCQALAHVHHALPADLRLSLLALNRSGPDELHRAAVAANALSDAYAAAVAAVLAANGAGGPAQVLAVGAHGQTVRHRPNGGDASGYTLQLLNGARLAERCGIDVVCDFRSRDVAAGGEGAPLVPAFHAARFARAGHSRAVLNIGGIANLTLLGRAGSVRGFDSGPGNVLMDLWCQQQRGQPYDADGAWAASGRCLPDWLAVLLSEPYLQRPAPKSTGRDLFDAAWLQHHAPPRGAAAADVMCTLTELTARSICAALQAALPDAEELVVCGGGARNGQLMTRLQALLGSGVAVNSSDAAGVPADQVEALAFAWLAAAHLARRPGSVPAVTGARGPRVLGALYPAA